MPELSRRQFFGSSVAALAGGCSAFKSPALSSPLPTHPNILVFLSDTLRADHLSCYGYQRPTTPNIDALADTGIVFEQCYAVATWTLPATATLLTGTHPLVHRTVVAEWSPEGLARGFQHQVVPESLVTTASELRARGYTTAAFQTNPNATADRGLSRGFQHFHFDMNVRPEQTVDAVIDWLEHEAVEPFFAYIHLIDPHEPYTADPALFADIHQMSLNACLNLLPAPEAYRLRDYHRHSWKDLFIADKRLGTEDLRNFSDASVQYLMGLYDSEIRRVDREFGRLQRWLQDRPMDQRTVRVVTSDHGEAFGEDDMFYHGSLLHDPQLHVPLVFGLPGLRRGFRSPWTVGQCDVHPTLLALAGIPSHAPGAGSPLLNRSADLTHPFHRPILSTLDLHHENADQWQSRLTCGPIRVDSTDEASRVDVFEAGDESPARITVTELDAFPDNEIRRAVEDFYLENHRLRQIAKTTDPPAWRQSVEFDEETFQAMGYL